MWFEWSRGVGAAVDDDELYFFFYEKAALNGPFEDVRKKQYRNSIGRAILFRDWNSNRHDSSSKNNNQRIFNINFRNNFIKI